MESSHGQRPSTALFDVYLRLRPSSVERERFLDVEHLEDNSPPTHITVKPPTVDNRKRAIEKFGFTRVFEEHAGQRELFESTGAVQLVEGVLGTQGREGRDGLVATLGVTGSGKSHTILGSKSQRGITQLTLDLLYQHTTPHLVDLDSSITAYPSLCLADVSESQLLPAANFLDSIYCDNGPSRGATPAPRGATPGLDTSFLSLPNSRRYAPRISTLPESPIIDDIELNIDDTAEYAIVVSMYEVHNDRIYDLLASNLAKNPQQKRRALLFKSTEKSPDRKVVAGLKKVICSDMEEALLVLETGLQERRVAGTGSNATSSRSHGFFCIEVKKRARGHSTSVQSPWTSSTLTIVDLAGSERARTAKTAGATLAEAGKINESLMYLGQCMQMQSDNATAQTPNLVPFRQCKLTELLFSNVFATPNSQNATTTHKSPQKSIMIVTADPLGDFNATTQILRYSALAREVPVPRIPSLTSTILSGTTVGATGTRSGRTTPSAVAEELEHALTELAGLRAELEVTQFRLEEETQRRLDAEASWMAAESRIEDIEADIREEVWSEMEAKMVQQQRQWRATRDAELDAQDEHLDRKLEIMARGIQIYEDDDKENYVSPGKDSPEKEDNGFGFVRLDVDEDRVAELEEENAKLQEQLRAMKERERGLRSPSKKIRVLSAKKWRECSGMGLEEFS